MIKKLGDLYGEALAGITPLIKSKKHHEYSQATKHIRDESKTLLQWILSTLGFNKETPKTDKGENLSQKDELMSVLIEAKSAVDTALDKNTVNLRTDLLDLIPVLVAKTGNPWIILVGILGFGISIYGSCNEFIYRLRELNPKMREAQQKYSDYIGEESDFKTKIWYRDILSDGVETAVEAGSFFAPGLIFASNFINFIIELPLDASSRNKYYVMGEEIRVMFDTISNENKDSE